MRFSIIHKDLRGPYFRVCLHLYFPNQIEFDLKSITEELCFSNY